MLTLLILYYKFIIVLLFFTVLLYAISNSLLEVLTIRGLKGGLIFLCSSSTQSISLKNGCTLIASSRPWDTTQPSRLLGLFVMN